MLQILGASRPNAIDQLLPLPSQAECGSNEKWYVVHIGPGYDSLIMNWFQWLSLEFYQFTRLDRQPKKKPVRRAVFPGYLFVRFDVEEHGWKIIPQIPGVVRILSEGAHQMRPLALPDGLMEKMIGQHCELVLPKEVILPRLIKAGAKLKIVSGPFTGFDAECVATDGEIVETIVKIMGRDSRIKMKAAALQEKST